MASHFNEMQRLFNSKLWHQLTDAVEAFVKDAATTSHEQLGADFYTALYEEFIQSFEGRVNQLRFARILVDICKLYENAQDAISLLTRTLEKRARLGPEAALFIECANGLFKLSLSDEPLVDEVGAFIRDKRDEVEGLASDDAAVPSIFYRLGTTYHKMVGPPHAFYRDALMFLAFTPMEGMTTDESYNLATDLSLAAITGDGIYNFGEVLTTPILSALKDTPNDWLRMMMRIFHDGDIDAFGQLVDEHGPAIQQQAAMMARMDFVKEKVALLAFMNLVFQRPAHERCIAFADIAECTRLPLDQVEWLAMRAMSLGLVKGIIDEVDETIEVSWLLPRVLELPQLAQLAARFGEWGSKVQETAAFLEEQTPELFQI